MTTPYTPEDVKRYWELEANMEQKSRYHWNTPVNTQESRKSLHDFMNAWQAVEDFKNLHSGKAPEQEEK